MRAYGPTADGPLHHHYAGSAYSAPSREPGLATDSWTGNSISEPRGPARRDAASGQYIADITKSEHWKSLYDLSTPRMNESMQSSYPDEMMDFPDVFDLPDLADIWMSRLKAHELWPVMKTMQMQLTDRLDYNFTELIFNDTTPDRIPEEGVPTLVTKQMLSYSTTLVRWAKGAKIERTAYLTAKGRKMFWIQVEQISVGTLYRMVHDVLTTLIVSEDNPERNTQQRSNTTNFNSDAKSIDMYFRDDLERRFMLNKDPDSIGVLVENMKKDFAAKAKEGSAPNRLIMFNGAKQFYQQFYSTPQNEYWRTGWRDGSSFNPLEAEVGGITYCESFDVSVLRHTRKPDRNHNTL